MVSIQLGVGRGTRMVRCISSVLSTHALFLLATFVGEFVCFCMFVCFLCDFCECFCAIIVSLCALFVVAFLCFCFCFCFCFLCTAFVGFFRFLLGRGQGDKHGAVSFSSIITREHRISHPRASNITRVHRISPKGIEYHPGASNTTRGHRIFVSLNANI